MIQPYDNFKKKFRSVKRDSYGDKLLLFVCKEISKWNEHEENIYFSNKTETRKEKTLEKSELWNIAISDEAWVFQYDLENKMSALPI
jgi:hypothetical protein